MCSYAVEEPARFRFNKSLDLLLIMHIRLQPPIWHKSTMKKSIDRCQLLSSETFLCTSINPTVTFTKTLMYIHNLLCSLSGG